MIPKNPPPTLDASFSKPLREFVAACLQRDPLLRPTAKELLKHRFIKSAKRTSYLIELIERLDRWKQEGGDKDERGDDRGDSDQECVLRGGSYLPFPTDSLALFWHNRAQLPAADLWDFGTVRHVQARPATLKKNQAAAAAKAAQSNSTSASSTQRQLPSIPPTSSSSQPAPPPGVKARDYAASQSRPLPPIQHDEPTFDTVRNLKPNASPNMNSPVISSAHSEYSDFSSSVSVTDSERARVELDRQRERIERDRRGGDNYGHQQQQQQRQQQQPERRWEDNGRGNGVGRGEDVDGGHARSGTDDSGGSDDVDGGSILESVVLPVLDSVSCVLSILPR